MAKWRIVVSTALLVLPLLLTGSSAEADQAFQRFVPLFIDLDGWQGKTPDGMSTEMPNASITTVIRDYRRGAAQAEASVMVGPAAAGAMQPLFSGINITTSERHLLTTTVNGMQMLKSYTNADKSGVLMVALDKNAMFRLSYMGISEDEALALAQKFDWKAIQAAAKAK